MGLFSPKMAQVEFEVEGRTYRVEVNESALFGELGGSHHEMDLISGKKIIVNWGMVGVFRVL